MASDFVSVAWPQEDTRRVNNPKETVDSLSADQIWPFQEKKHIQHLLYSTGWDT